MAGLRPDTPIPTEIKLHQKSRILELSFDNGDRFELSFEFLRVFSPSAEVRPVFSDGHESGLYSWDILHGLGSHRDELWQAYLDKLKEAGASRDPAECPAAPEAPTPSCGIKR